MLDFIAFFIPLAPLKLEPKEHTLKLIELCNVFVYVLGLSDPTKSRTDHNCARSRPQRAAVVSASNFFTVRTVDDLANNANVSNAVETTMADVFTPTEVTDFIVELDQDNNLISVTFMAPGDDEDQGTCKNIISL